MINSIEKTLQLLLTVGLLSQLTSAAPASLNATTTISPTKFKEAFTFYSITDGAGLPILTFDVSTISSISLPGVSIPTLSIPSISLPHITAPTAFTTEVTIGGLQFEEAYTYYSITNGLGLPILTFDVSTISTIEVPTDKLPTVAVPTLSLLTISLPSLFILTTFTTKGAVGTLSVKEVVSYFSATGADGKPTLTHTVSTIPSKPLSTVAASPVATASAKSYYYTTGADGKSTSASEDVAATITGPTTVTENTVSGSTTGAEVVSYFYTTDANGFSTLTSASAATVVTNPYYANSTATSGAATSFATFNEKQTTLVTVTNCGTKTCTATLTTPIASLSAFISKTTASEELTTLVTVTNCDTKNCTATLTTPAASVKTVGGNSTVSQNTLVTSAVPSTAAVSTDYDNSAADLIQQVGSIKNVLLLAVSALMFF